MTTLAIKTEFNRRQALLLLEKRALPFSVSVTKGVPRSIHQNRLQRLWLNEAAEQGDQTAEEYRGYCKLHFGVAILYLENEAFADAYDRVVAPLSYELKLLIMMLPLDLPVTRLMDTKQKTQYLDAMYQHFTGLGFQLTEPGP